MNETTYDSDGNIVEQIIDNLDGTGTLTVYENGEVASTTTVDCPLPEPPTMQEVVSKVDPEVLVRAITLAGVLTSNPAAFDAATGDIAESNTAKEVIEMVNTAVQMAAVAEIPA